MKRTFHRAIRAICVLVVATGAVSQAATYYVAPDGDNSSGLTWSSAFTSIQSAIDRCGTIGNDTIRVKQGTYAITTPIRVTKAVLLYGGYSGVDDMRNPAVYLTIVNGTDTAAHCFHVTANATIDGFRISHGLGFGTAPANFGGGMFIDTCDPIIYACTFEDNYAELAGGAIGARYAGGSVSDCEFVVNSSGEYGGAICMLSCDIALMDCEFTGNRCEKSTTTCGGAIYNEDSTPTVTECIFSGNAANQGAGIFNAGSDAIITECEFGGVDSGSARGGGIYNYESDTEVKSCLFKSNAVSISGGAIYEAEGSGSNIVNCIIRNNAATALGGGLYTDNGTTTTITNCTLYANTAGSRGGAVYNYYGKPTFTNCIIWGNSASMAGPSICNESESIGMVALVRYTDIQGTTLYTGAGNINVDPDFVYPAGDDLHLNAGSPCIDAGTNGIATLEIEDFEDNPRIVDGNLDASAVVDMGAYEHQMGVRVSDHLAWVHISQGQLYESPSATAPGYLFVAEMQTDNSVDHIDFLSAAGYAYRITSAAHTSSNGVETFHEVNGTVNTWRYWARFSSASALSAYGDGGYLVVLYYKDGSTQQTNVSFVLPGTQNAVPWPTQRPTIVNPAQGAAVSSPVTFTWDACTDTSVTKFFLAIVEPATGNEVVTDDIGTGVTISDPYDLEEGEYRAELAFESAYSVTNTDGIAFRYGKAIVSRGEFEVVNAVVYRFWSPITSVHFYTISNGERTNLVNNYAYAWNYEGPAYKACVTAYHPGLSPVYRFWSPYSSCHFYTISEAERDNLIQSYAYWWTYEGIAYYAYPEGDQPSGTNPVYRFWSPVTSCHFYTMNPEEKAYIIREWCHVFTYEGVAFYAYP